MISSKADLRAGDLVWAVLDPVMGTEQGGRRPVIILTDHRFNSREPRSIGCPITRNIEPWPTKVLLPAGMRMQGAILVDQVRSLHREGRSFRFIESAPDEVLAEVRTILAAIIGITS